MCLAETFHIFTRQPRTKKTLRNIYNRLVFYWCVSNIQLIAGKWKKKTKALLLGFGEEARKRTSCQVHMQEHRQPAAWWLDFTDGYNANLWVGCNSYSDTNITDLFSVYKDLSFCTASQCSLQRGSVFIVQVLSTNNEQWIIF